jgi:carboxylesterase
MPDFPDRNAWHPGNSTGVLLIHGLGGTPVELRLLTLALATAGYTVLAVQLAGHGGTPADLARSNWHDWFASVRAAHDRLRATCDVVLVAGLSMGALLAARLAQTRPSQIQGLMLLAPALRLDGWAMPWYARLLGMLPHALIPLQILLPERQPHGIKDERIRGLVLRDMATGTGAGGGQFATPLAALSSFTQLARRVRLDLAVITQPTLIIHPRWDDMASLRTALIFQAGLSGQTECLILDDSYHLITLDRQRRQVKDRVLAFAADNSRQTGTGLSGCWRSADRALPGAHAAPG